MDASTWQLISIIGYSLSAILFIVVIIMFFKMNIPAIYGYLTGKTAEKHIQAMRRQTSKTTNRRYEPIPFNQESEEITVRIPKSKRLLKTGKTRKTGQTASMRNHTKRQTGNMSTSQNLERVAVDSIANQSKQNQATKHNSTSDDTELLLDETKLLVEETELLVDETELLEDGTEVLIDETQVLDDDSRVLADETQVLDDGTQVLADETEVLVDEDKTTVLGNTDELYPKDRPTKHEIGFTIVKDMKIIHTDETIKDEIRDK